MPAAILRAIATAETAPAEAKLASFGRKIDALGKGGSQSLSKLQVAGRVAFAAVGVAAIAGIGKAINTTVQLGAETRTLARQLGISAEDASRLRVSAETLGISTDDLSRSFGIFSKHLVDGGAAFEKYGITLKDGKGNQKSFNEVLGEAADQYLKLAPGVQRTAFALDLFGRGGKTLIPLLSQGSAGIAKMGDEAERLGLVLNEKDLKATRALAIAQQQLHEAFQGVEVAIGRGFLPVLKVTAEVLTAAVTIFNKLPGPLKQSATLVIGLGGALTGLGLALRIVRASLAGFGVQLGATTTAEGVAATSTGGLSAALVGLKGAILGAATAGVGLAVGLGVVGGATAEAIGGQKRHAEHLRAVTGEEQKLTAALNAGKISLRDVTSAAGGNQAALKKVAAAAGIAVDVTEKFTPDTIHLREALVAVGKTAPKTPNAIKATGDAAATATPHIRSAADVLDYYARIAASVRTVRFLSGIPGDIRRGHRAQHGGFHRGLTLVGEEGPELVNFGQSGAYVHTNTQTQTMARDIAVPAGIGGSISGDIILQIDGREFGRISRDQLLKLKPSRVSLGLT